METLVPQRATAPVKFEDQTLHVSGASRALRSNDPHADEVLKSYLGLLYELRDTSPGAWIPLRDEHLDSLADILGGDPDAIEHRLVELMDVDREEAAAMRAVLLRRKFVLPAVGIAMSAGLLGGGINLMNRGRADGSTSVASAHTASAPDGIAIGSAVDTSPISTTTAAATSISGTPFSSESTPVADAPTAAPDGSIAPVDDTTPAVDDTVAPPVVDETVTPPVNTTVAPPADDTTVAPDDTVAQPDDTTVAPDNTAPVDTTVAPPADDTVAPPADDTVTTPDDDHRAPPTPDDTTVAPPADDTTAAPDDTVAPPVDDTTAAPDTTDAAPPVDDQQLQQLQNDDATGLDSGAPECPPDAPQQLLQLLNDNTDDGGLQIADQQQRVLLLFRGDDSNDVVGLAQQQSNLSQLSTGLRINTVDDDQQLQQLDNGDSGDDAAGLVQQQSGINRLSTGMRINTANRRRRRPPAGERRPGGR